MLVTFFGPILALVEVLRVRREGPEAWEELTRRGGWTWKFSRLDVLFYGTTLMTMFGVLGMTVFRTTEVTEQTAENTKRMGDVVEQMHEAGEQSLAMLAAMREDAEAARRETSAAQRLAIWVGIGTALIGAVLGGIAGAFAGKIIGS